MAGRLTKTGEISIVDLQRGPPPLETVGNRQLRADGAASIVQMFDSKCMERLLHHTSHGGESRNWSMKSRLSATVLALATAAFCGPAGATVAYLYDFTLLSITCTLPTDVEWTEQACAYGEERTRGMEDVSVVLDEDAARRGTAQLWVEGGPPNGSEVVLNEGFLGATTYSGIDLFESGHLQGGSINLLVSIFLRGGFIWGDTNDSFSMSSDDFGVWSGHYSSDAISWSGTYPMLFTGEFRLVEILAVPSSLPMWRLCSSLSCWSPLRAEGPATHCATSARSSSRAPVGVHAGHRRTTCVECRVQLTQIVELD